MLWYGMCEIRRHYWFSCERMCSYSAMPMKHVCRYYMLGRCLKGEGCDFFHPNWSKLGMICNLVDDAIGSAKAGQCSAKAAEDISKTSDWQDPWTLALRPYDHP